MEQQILHIFFISMGTQHLQMLILTLPIAGIGSRESILDN